MAINSKSRRAVLAAALAAAPIGVVVEASPAAAATAPSCVYARPETHWYTFHVHIRNNCSSRVRVKPIIAWYYDGSCRGLDPGESYTHSHAEGRFVRLDNC